MTHNTGKGQLMPITGHSPPNMSIDHLQIDFIEITLAEGKKQDAEAKALLSEIIPLWGVPLKISSYNSTPFVNQAPKTSQ